MTRDMQRFVGFDTLGFTLFVDKNSTGRPGRPVHWPLE